MGAVASVATEVDDAKTQIEVVLKKLGQVSNLVAVHDIKLGEVDGAIVDLQAGLEHVKHVLEKLPGELLDKVAEHVARSASVAVSSAHMNPWHLSNALLTLE